MDQGLFSGANFIVNILLARWLSVEEYGSYAVTFSIFLVFNGFYIALVLEPASVLAPSRYESQLAEYLRSLFPIHFWLCVLSSILFILIGGFTLFFRNVYVAYGLLGCGISVAFVFLAWLVRRIFYVVQKPDYAVVTSFIYFWVFVVGIIFLRDKDSLSVFSTFILNGLAGLGGAITGLLIGRKEFSIFGGAALDWRNTLKLQWNYGKWRTSGNILAVAFGQFQTFLVAGILGLDSAGVLRVLQNFVQPMAQIQTAVESLVLPTLSKEYGLRNYRVLRKKAFVASMGLFALAAIYLSILWFFRIPLVGIVYTSKYLDYVNLFPIIGLLPLTVSLATSFTLILLAIQRPQYYLIVYLINAPITIFFSIVMINHLALIGSVLSLILPVVVNLLVSWALYIRWFPKEVEQ